MNFMEVWLPTIVGCIFGGALTIAAARWVNSNGSKRNAELMYGIIRILGEKFHVELVRDADGRPTGGQVIRLAATAGAMSTMTANLTAGPASIVGTGTVTARIEK
jgi:hypothetical protein